MTPSAEKQRCDTCRFWRRLEAGELCINDEKLLLMDSDIPTAGQCRRYPPVIDTLELRKELETEKGPFQAFDGPTIENYLRMRSSHFPLTSDYEWCGEWAGPLQIEEASDVPLP